MFVRFASLSSVTWVTIEKATQQGLWLALFVILAPILGPRAYGIFSIVTVFVGFCEFVLSEGAIEALVSMGRVEDLHRATANLANVTIAGVLGLLLFGSAPLIGAFFHSDEIRLLIWTLIPLPVLSLLSATPIAELRRTRQFKRLAIRSIVAYVIGAAVAIALAISGAGVWALAGQALVQRAAEVLIAWFSVPLRFRLGWSTRHFTEMKPIALNVYAARAMVFGNGQLSRLIIGYTLGPTALGLFAMASRFLETINVMILQPYASVGRIELQRWNPKSSEFERHFSTMIQGAALLSLPILVGTAAVIPNLFQIWLGEHWLDGMVPAQLVVLSGLPLALVYCSDATFLAARLSSVFMWTAAIQAVTTALSVLCLSPFGLVAISAALAIRPWALVPLYLVLLRRHFGWLSYQSLLSPLRSLLGALIMGVILSVPFLREPVFGQTLDLIMLVCIGVLSYGLFSIVFQRGALRALLRGMYVQRSGETTAPDGVGSPSTAAMQPASPQSVPDRVGTSDTFAEQFGETEGSLTMPKHDRETLERLSFRRQFVLGPQFVRGFPNWQKVKLDGSLHITAHPDLEICRIGRDDRSITLLGYILDPGDPSATNVGIIGQLFDKLDTCEGFFEDTARFGGRWILIVNDGRRIVLFTDAAGLRQVCFATVGASDRIWCASQPKLLAEILDLSMSRGALSFMEMEIDGYGRGKRLSWYPGDTTPYEAIRQLMPNHYLDLGTGQVQRYWPNADLPATAPREGLLMSLGTLRGLMESARRRFDLAVSLTAGLDSRVLLAMTAPFGREMFYFTAMFGDLTEDHRDVKIPNKLVSKMGLKNNIIRCQDDLDEEFGKIYQRNVGKGHELYGLVSQGIIDQIPKERICIRGDVAEIAKCYYRLGKSASTDITGHDLARLSDLGAHPFVIRAFEQWLLDVRPHLHNVHLLDLFFWEQEAGRLHAMIQSECDIAQDAFSPFNCRSLLMTMLSVPERLRRPPEHIFFWMLLRGACPDVLNEPINGRVQVGIEAVARRSLAKLGLLALVTGPIKKLINIADFLTRAGQA